MNSEKKEKLLEDLITSYSEIMYNNSLTELSCTSEEKALWLIARSGGSINPKRLSEIMNVTMPRVTTLLNGMDKKGLITREMAADDRRKVVVTITRKGRNINSKINKRSRDYISRILDQLTAEEGEAVLKYFNIRISLMDSDTVG